jgi:hypothetical protein
MFEHWSDFFLLVGSAAAVLIGLIFVVISLLQDRSRSTVLAGTRLYMGPIVLGISFVLTLSAAALTPGVGRCAFAALTGVVAIWGLARGVISTLGIQRLTRIDDEPPHWTDIWFYGVIPCGIYIAFGIVALAYWQDLSWAGYGLAGVITAALLLAIRNEWDLITWIAPRSDAGRSS